MNVITATSSLTLDIAPRYYTNTVTIELITEGTGISATYSSTLATASNYYTLDIGSISFTDGNYYLMKVKDGDDEIFRGKVFYTTTISDPYRRTVVDSDYKENSIENKYIIYGQ